MREVPQAHAARRSKLIAEEDESSDVQTEKEVNKEYIKYICRPSRNLYTLTEDVEFLTVEDIPKNGIGKAMKCKMWNWHMG